MSCVAHKKTSANHHHVKPHIPLPSSCPACSIIPFTFDPSHSIENPEMVWIGKIQLFLLPSLGVQTASTMGLQNSFNEYGYAAREKTPIDEYETTLFNRNGTDPAANPIGMPCRKYSKTSNKKFL